mmetsp:Transcript_27519/g.50800  ORF Transcript_27519/g.50800 Transcript_27519/m.50800 type:complete len:220 (+) Transcript_27519:48-707(+)
MPSTWPDLPPPLPSRLRPSPLPCLLSHRQALPASTPPPPPSLLRPDRPRGLGSSRVGPPAHFSSPRRFGSGFEKSVFGFQRHEATAPSGSAREALPQEEGTQRIEGAKGRGDKHWPQLPPSSSLLWLVSPSKSTHSPPNPDPRMRYSGRATRPSAPPPPSYGRRAVPARRRQSVPATSSYIFRKCGSETSKTSKTSPIGPNLLWPSNPRSGKGARRGGI